MSRKNRLDKGRINMILERYKRSSLRERGRIITELCEDYGVKRKAVVRAFARADGKSNTSKKRGRRTQKKARSSCKLQQRRSGVVVADAVGFNA